MINRENTVCCTVLMQQKIFTNVCRHLHVYMNRKHLAGMQQSSLEKLSPLMGTGAFNTTKCRRNDRNKAYTNRESRYAQYRHVVTIC